MSTGNGSGNGKGRAAGPTYNKNKNGYYTRVPNDGNVYYLGSDGRYHVLITLRGAIGVLPANGPQAFNEWMRQHNNTFTNHSNQLVEFDSAIVSPEGLHTSTALGDPYPREGHYSILLSNDELMRNDRSTHLVHFRPDNMEHTVFYARSYTATEVTRMQNKRRTLKGNKGPKKDDNKNGGAGPSKK